MTNIAKLINEIGISKVKLATYFGVSRQMIYNYLDIDDLNKWPKDKRNLLFKLLDVNNIEELENLEVTNLLIEEVENKIEEVTKRNEIENTITLDGLEQEEKKVLSDIFFLLKEMIEEERSPITTKTLHYIYHFLQTMDNSPEIRYILGYISKSAALTDPYEFVYDKEEQFIFESVLYLAITLYKNGNTSESKISETHRRFVHDIEIKKEEILTRTQELNTARIQALKELGYTTITEENSAEVMAKITEIDNRRV